MPASKRDEKIITPILEKVDRKENALDKRFRWMDHDYNHGWRLDAFKPLPSEGVRPQDIYTSNYPKVLNTRTSGAIGFAERIIRVEDDADNQEFRDQNNSYERLAIGMLENGDERLADSVKPPLQGGAAWMATVRGAWIAARSVLIKDEEGETIEDIWPIDQRGLVYEPGTGEPLWAAIVTERSKQSIRDDYPGFKFEGEQGGIDDEDELARVVDYYWTTKDKPTKTEDGEEIPGRKRRMNAVIIDRQFAKKPTDTFAVNFPIVIRLIGNNPGVSNFTIKDNTEGKREINGIEDVGDSMYTPLRETVPNINRMRSYRQALTHKAVQGTLLVESKDGTKELDQDVFEDGAEIQISTDNNEKISLLEVAQLTQDSTLLEQAYLADQNNAGISQQRLGNFPGPVSGSALRIVGQSDNDVIAPFLEAVQSLIKGVIDNLGKQFETGRYKPIKVRGKARGGVPFNTVIKPEDIKGHGVLSVELAPSQPEDEIERWQTAQVAAQVDPATGLGLVSPQYAAEKIAKVQDWDLEKTRQFAMRARTSSEEAIWLTQLEAAFRTNDQDVIEFVQENLQRAREKQDMEDMARRMAFAQAFGADPIQASAEGLGGGPSANGNGVQQQGDPATLNVDPRLISNSGRAGVDRTPSPDAGFNTTAPRGGDNGLEPNV